MTASTLTKTIFLKAPRELVWDYLTRKDMLARWFHESDVNLEEGKDYALLSDDKEKADRKLCWGRVVSADKPNQLIYTFTHDHLEGVESKVTWQLIDAFGGTKLVLTHEGLDGSSKDAFDMISDHDEGWDEHFVRLRKAVLD